MTERPKRIQRKRTKGWRMPPNTVAVARPSRWGNPFKIEDAREAGFVRDEAKGRRFVVDCFRNWIRGSDQWWQGEESDRRRKWMQEHLPELRGKDLACYCPLDQPCHADVLLELANVHAED